MGSIERLKWVSLRKIAEAVVRSYGATDGEHALKIDAATRTLEEMGLGIDRRVNRLCEQIREEVCFKGLNDMAVVRTLLRKAFQMRTIQAVDEEGQPLVVKKIKTRKKVTVKSKAKKNGNS